MDYNLILLILGVLAFGILVYADKYHKVHSFFGLDDPNCKECRNQNSTKRSRY
jgi:hypothetical protein